MRFCGGASVALWESLILLTGLWLLDFWEFGGMTCDFVEYKREK
jgi:hypothetical protein